VVWEVTRENNGQVPNYFLTIQLDGGSRTANKKPSFVGGEEEEICQVIVSERKPDWAFMGRDNELGSPYFDIAAEKGGVTSHLLKIRRTKKAMGQKQTHTQNYFAGRLLHGARRSGGWESCKTE